MDPESTDGVRLYVSKVQDAIQGQTAQLQQLQGYREQLQSALGLLTELPKKLHHKVSVPFGRHAFFPGQLQNTNEFTVHLAANYYVHCTAHQASDIIKRRLSKLDETVAAAQKNIEQHNARLQASATSAVIPGIGPNGEEVQEIRELYDDSEALLATARSAARVEQVETNQRNNKPAPTSSMSDTTADTDFDKIMARMDELAALEEQAEADGTLEHVTDDQPASQEELKQQRSSVLSLPEAEPDSDDEDDEDFANAFMPVNLASTTSAPSSTSQPAQPSSQHSSSVTQAQTSKPAIKKGFLLTGSKASSSKTAPTEPKTHTTGPAPTSQVEAAAKSPAMDVMRKQAFTGAVIERVADASPVNVQTPAIPSSMPTARKANFPVDTIPSVVERPVSMPNVAQVQEPAAPKVSKFKLARQAAKQ